jgi:hypothetical protein
MRIYDTRLGRFLTVDPLTKSYPELTPYQFASNTPIQGIDLDGLEIYKTNSYVGMSVEYNTKLKKITSGTVYYRTSQLPDDLTNAIKRANTCDNCIGSDAIVASFKLLFKSPLITTSDDAQMDNIDQLPSSLEAQNHGQPIVPKNSSEARTQRKTKEFSTQGIESSNAKVNAAIAIIDLTGKALTYLANENMKDIVKQSEYQARTAANSVVPLINDAIKNNLIPEDSRNRESLTGIANYILYGAPINKFEVANNKVNLILDKKLTEIGNKLIAIYSAEQAKMKVESQKRQEANSSNPIDNTKIKQ